MRSPEFIPVYRNGECDTCHGSFELFAFEDDEYGEWTYCERCAGVIRRNRIKKIEEKTGEKYCY